MRTDENGGPCPATLGEYRDPCAAFRSSSAATRLLDERIADAPHGRDKEVIAADSQMRMMLMPLLVKA